MSATIELASAGTGAREAISDEDRGGRRQRLVLPRLPGMHHLAGPRRTAKKWRPRLVDQALRFLTDRGWGTRLSAIDGRMVIHSPHKLDHREYKELDRFAGRLGLRWDI